MKKIAILLVLLVCTFHILAQPVRNFEFRGVWIATVENIDWPSKRGLPVETQQKEFVTILDMHQKNGMNAVVVQVRPAADAMYPSSFEPSARFYD